MIHIRRIYDPPLPSGGQRFLVDRLWPRGLTREAAQLDAWVREAAPSNALRAWYHHAPDEWDEFCRRYFAELDTNPAAWQPLLEAARKGEVTLLYSARNTEHNNALALKIYIEQHSGVDA